jgi:alpha-tubulin suppressor-like RCC1 family protein
MRGVTDLITKINTIINSGTATELQLIQLSGAVESIEKHGVASVATPAYLPNPVMNKGRFLFIESTNSYTFSNGRAWGIDGIKQTPLYSWGNNYRGTLGDGTTTDKSSPVAVIGGFTDWIQVDASRHTVGVRANGTAWAWGDGNYGRLGDGTTTDKSSPVSVVGGFTDWVQVSTGAGHMVGLRANGTAWAWGVGSNGRLGDGTTVSKSSPVSVVGGFTDWVQVSGGGQHSAGIRSNGTAWAWGYGGIGRLGDNTTVDKSSPVSVVGGFTDWVQVDAGQDHTAGVRANGTAWAWGYGRFGRLGDNTTTNKSSPVSVVGGFVDWVQLSIGQAHTVGVRANGTAWAWGIGTQGPLGDNTTTNKSSPVSVVGGFTDWVQVSAGAEHTIGLRANGTAWAWGSNGSGRLGSPGAAKSSPVSVDGGFTDWVQVSAGVYSSVGLKSS